MAAYIVFETGHTFGPSMLYPVYRLVDSCTGGEPGIDKWTEYRA